MHLPQKAQRAEVDALFQFVRDKIRYVKDIDQEETIHTADAVLELGAGDCDDKAVLLAALLLSIGYKPAFACLNQGRGWVHVWVRVATGNPQSPWLDLEPTEPYPSGRSVPIKPGRDKVMTWPI